MRSMLLVAIFLIAATVHGQEFHTSPHCWDKIRTYASGTTDRIQVSVTKIERATELDGTPSPNGAYQFDITGRATDADPEWYPRLIIFNERPYLLEVRFPNTRAISEAEWINENLIYVRLWWGRVAGSDFIVDVEREKVVYQQPIRWGDSAIQQYEQCAVDDWKDEEQCRCFELQGRLDDTPPVSDDIN